MNLSFGDSMTVNEKWELMCAITAHGHAVISIDEGRTPYAFTVGLSHKQGFELLMFGVAGDLATILLNNAAQVLKTFDLPDGRDIEHVVADHPVRLRTLPISKNPALETHLSHIWWMGFQPKEVRIVMWADENGRFPGDPLYAHLVSQSIEDFEDFKEPN